MALGQCVVLENEGLVDYFLKDRQGKVQVSLACLEVLDASVLLSLTALWTIADLIV